MGTTITEPQATGGSKIAPASKMGLDWIAFVTAKKLGWITFGTAILICTGALGWAAQCAASRTGSKRSKRSGK
eukprot:368006-Karenia_brevis.AAC.1